MSLKDFMDSGKYLPSPLRDFHDAKDVFKLIHRVFGGKSEGIFKYYNSEITWISGQCYVIDWFLWFMAQRGWTLQRSRLKLDYRDLVAEIKQMKEEDSKAFFEELNARPNRKDA